MNFSNTNTLRKLLSLLLAVTLVLGMFAGCMKKDSDETEDTSEPSINISLDDDTEPSETQTEPTESEPLVINENMATVINQLTVRSSPSKEANNTGTLDAGDIVEILRREHVTGLDWGYITEPVVGWICLDYVTMMVPSENTEEDTSTPAGNANQGTESSDEATQSVKGVITGNGLNIRSEASTNGTIVGTYAKGEVVTILETKNGWGRTSKGWINMDYVNTTSTTGTTTNNANGNTNTTTTDKTTTTTTGDGSTTVIAKGIVTASELNVRSTASTEGDRVKTLTYGARVEIYEKSGSWGRISDGWIHLDYVYQDGTTGSKTAKGIVTGNGLNIRSGPGTGYGSVGTYSSGDRVNILEQFTYNGTTWGCTSKGWISMDYVYVDGTDVGESGSGTVTADDLNIRSGPGTAYDSVGKYNSGDTVTILYQVTVGNTIWGCTSKGWISLDYVNLD